VAFGGEVAPRSGDGEPALARRLARWLFGQVAPSVKEEWMLSEDRDGRPVARYGRQTSRRGVLVVAALLSVLVLAACGSNSKNKSGAQAGNVSTASGKELVKLLGYSSKDLSALKGKTINLGAILALSGPESAHGTSMRRGLELAKKDIQAAGGPTLNIDYQDHKSADPQAGVGAARKLGESGHAITLTSYEFVFGAQLPAFKRYKMLAIDPGGGTGGLFNGNDYAWGFRGIEPDDALKGGWQYIHQTHPNVKRVGNVIWDLGDAFVNTLTKHTSDALQTNGMQLAGTIRSKIGTTDYSDAISKLRGMNVDAVHLNMAGLDLAYFTKQWRQAGMKQPVLGNEYLPEMAPIAGKSFEGYLFAVDYWQPQDAPNPLSKLFQKHFTESYGKAPTSFYEANFYEAGLAIWELAKRITESGSDINSGADWQKALAQNPEFKSVYGGDAQTVGTIKLDTTTHSPTVRPDGVWEIKNGKPVQVAGFNVGGSGFKVLKKSGN
jgi:branched-chain amino acid transport system substrate-binding protein